MPIHKERLSVYLCCWLLLLILLACLDNLAQSKQNFLFHYVQFSCPNNYEVKYNETTNAQKVFVNGGNPHTTLPLFHPSDFKPVFLPKPLNEECYRLLSFPRWLSTINIIQSHYAESLVSNFSPLLHPEHSGILKIVPSRLIELFQWLPPSDDAFNSSLKEIAFSIV